MKNKYAFTICLGHTAWSLGEGFGAGVGLPFESFDCAGGDVSVVGSAGLLDNSIVGIGVGLGVGGSGGCRRIV